MLPALCHMMSGPLKLCCLDKYNILCRYLSMLLCHVYILACHHRKRFIVLFRLAHWLLALKWTARYSRPSLWVSVLPSTSQTATWTPGNWVCRPSSLWATSSGSPKPVQELLAGKGAHLEFSLSRKATTLGPWKNQPLTMRIEQKKEASRSSVSPFKEKINIWNFSFTCIVSIFGKAIGRLA